LFDVKSKPCGAELISHRLIIKSSSTFDTGVLGYMYYFNGREIAVEFPGKVDRGINIYPLIYLSKASLAPVVCLIGGTNGDVTIENGKIKHFRYLFS